MMNVDDPKLTAYALDELPVEEATILRREIAASAEAEQFVAETRELAKMLRDDYEAEREAESVRPSNLIDIRGDRWFWDAGRPLAIAAVIAVFAIIGAIAIGTYKKMPSENYGTVALPARVTLPPLPTPEVEGYFVAEDPSVDAREEEFAKPANHFAPGTTTVPTGNAPSVDLLSNKRENLQIAAATPGIGSLDQNRPVRAPVSDSNGLPGRETVSGIFESPFLDTVATPLSTFPIDVDTASYVHVRDFINQGSLPSKEAVRLAEMINYFNYDYPAPNDKEPVSINVDVAGCPWAATHRLVRIGLKGSDAGAAESPAVAKEVSVQVEFNPARVSSHRLLGFERRTSPQDPAGEAKSPGREMRAGQMVTALYEVVPAATTGRNPAASVSPIGPLKYATQANNPAGGTSTAKEMLTVRLRYKAPAGDKNESIERAVTDSGAGFEKASADFKFAAAVAEFGMLLRDSEHKGSGSFATVLEWAEQGKGADPNRAGFIELVKKAQSLTKG